MNSNYNTNFFVPTSLDHAKQIILTPEDQTVEFRWKNETEWTVKLLDAIGEILPSSIVLDWGCGIGRLSKALIDNFGCKVVGIDIQPQMLNYAKEYVNSDKFVALNYSANCLENYKNNFSHCIAVWVLQHSEKVQFEVPDIYNALNSNGKLFVVELDKKAIPCNTGFYDDGISTKSTLECYFTPESLGKIPLKYTSSKIQSMSWWGMLNKKH